jgi:hypothetical protein
MSLSSGERGAVCAIATLFFPYFWFVSLLVWLLISYLVRFVVFLLY